MLWRDSETQRAEARRIGDRLRWAREGHEMTRVQLAAHAGIDWTMVRNMEAGTRVPSVFLAMSLCHILGISPPYLLWGILEGCESELAARLWQDHREELRHSAMPIVHQEMPNPGKTGKSRRHAGPASTAQND
jgi:DNA-binding XRE family transcriptional regulator